MVESKLEGGSVNVEEVVNDNINALHEDYVRYSVGPRGFVGFQCVDRFVDLPPQEEAKTRDRCRIVKVCWDGGGGWGGEERTNRRGA